MRIITGKYKGRHFDIPHTFTARPTTDCAKENLFNVLRAYVDFEECTALDLFAGTGSISLELLSRGCREVISVEQDRYNARFISKCMLKLGVDNNILIRDDVFRFLKKCRQQFDIIFADPPYSLPQLPLVPGFVFNGDLLKPDGILIVEHGSAHDFSAVPRFKEKRTYGSVNFSLFI